MRKDVAQIVESDFPSRPLWTYVNDDELGETLVQSVDQWPVETLDGHLVLDLVTLCCGEKVLTVLSNVNVLSATRNSHFLGLSFIKDAKRFHLARYHDFGQETWGPKSLAKFLGKGLDDIFPIEYDLRRFVLSGDQSALCNQYVLDTQHKLSRKDLIALSLKDD